MHATGGRRAAAFAGALLCAAMVVAPGASAEEPYEPPRPTHNLFGMTGLIDTPTADMQPDGQVSITGGYLGGTVRSTLSAQFLPGIEAAFRYSSISEFFPNGGALFDRSFDVKVRLVKETELWPAFAIGLQDFLGTGIYSSEYLVVTKGVNAGGFGHFRVTAGAGWGRFAGGGGIENPLRGFSEGFGTRTGFSGAGGTVNFGQYFSGEDLGFFGGIEWRTPIKGLTVKAEISGDPYTQEARFGDFETDWPVNIGIEYRPTGGIGIGAYYLYGSEFGVRLSFSGNPFRPIADYDTERGAQPLLPRQPLPNGAEIAGLGDVRTVLSDAPTRARFNDPRLGAVTVHMRLGSVRWADAVLTVDDGRCPDDLARAIDAQYGVIDAVTFKRPGGTVLCTVALRPAGQHAVRITRRVSDHYPTDWYEDDGLRGELAGKLAEELAGEEIGLIGVEIGPHRVSIFIENTKYFHHARAIGRSARALTRMLPPSVEVFEITPIENGLAVSTIVLSRSQLEEQVDRPDAGRRAWATSEIREAAPVVWGETNSDGNIVYPRFAWSVTPAFPASLFDPDQPVRVDAAIVGEGSIELQPGLTVTAAISKRIVGDLDDIDRAPDSLVENHVRSEIAQYLREGDPALVRFTGDYVTKISGGLYGRVSAGLLERMFGGVSGEVLWKPVDQTWGAGIELNYVRQRDFDTLFSFQDYSVLTGHASVYWNTGFYGLSTQLDAGRYLAGDWGATFSLTRRFTNGWEIGGFFTLTDIPFSEFGEGSFDKGLFLTIPFNWIVPFETRETYPIVLRPLTRDGGQRLEVQGRLWRTVKGLDRPHIYSGWEDFWR